MSNREQLSQIYVKPGLIGLEIGAYHNPFPVPRGTTMHYVDKLPRAELVARAEADPNLKGYDLSKIPETTFIGDGEVCAGIEPGTYDFVVNSHVLEHCKDPIGAVQRWLSFLKCGGVLLMMIPDKEHTFDRARKLTTWHELRERHESPEALDRHIMASFTEWYTLVDPKPDPSETARIRMDAGDDIHFNVWTARTLYDKFLQPMLRSVIPYARIERYAPAGFEIFVIIRRTE